MRLFLLLIVLFYVPAFSALAQNYTLDEDLIYRINFGSSEDVKLLLGKGANPNARTRQGETAFNVALERNDKESEGMAEALVEAGSDIETADKDGNTPIITAIKYKLTGVVKMMLSKGVNVHSNAPDGTPLIDYARKYGTPEIVALIQPILDKEKAYAQSLRTPERFRDVVRLYVRDSCTYQYWTYFVASRQAPEQDAENNKKIDLIKAHLYELIQQVQPYYTSSSNDSMVKLANEAVKQIYEQLDEMVSNTNRSEHGIGHDEDARSRCEKIVDAMPIQLMPVGVTPVYNTPAPAPVGGKPSQVQLPMDPSQNAGKPASVTPMAVTP